MQIATFRFIILAPLLLSQLYLFLRAKRALLSFLKRGRVFYGAITLTALIMSALFVMNSSPLLRRTAWLEPSRGTRILLFYLPAIWVFGALFSAIILGLARCAAILVKTSMRIYRKEVRPGADPSRRRFLRLGAATLAAAPFVISAYGSAYVARKGTVSETTVPFGVTLKVVQLSDIHAGVYMTRRDIGRYVDMVLSLDPDLFVLTGDFISNSMAFFPNCMKEIVRVRPRYGTFAIVGNHDRWFGKLGEIRRIFATYGIPLLVNAHHVIRTHGGVLAVAGIDDLRTGYPSLDKALHGLDSHVPVLLLSHHPEIFPQAASRGIPLTLAGHYHGGQIKVGGISLAHLVTPYPEGLFEIGDSRLYVSRGVGTTFTPIRLGVPAEVTLLRLT